MRCNACWRELEERAVSTTCGTEDASKILNSDAPCPICDQVLSESLMKPVEINPNDEWINMAMAGISPEICILYMLIPFFSLNPSTSLNRTRKFETIRLFGGTRTSSSSFERVTKLNKQNVMKSAYRSVMFYIGQRELEMQYKMNRVVAQCRQKCESMQEKFTEKLEQLHTAYQKIAERCQMMEQEIVVCQRINKSSRKNFQRNPASIRLYCETGSSKHQCFPRQKRKLDEMYDQLRNEYDSMKRSAIQPANNLFSRNEPDLFANHAATMLDSRNPIWKVDLIPADWTVSTPPTPGPREVSWPARQNSPNSGPFDISDCSPAKQAAMPVDFGNRRPGAVRAFGAGSGNPSMTLRNLILSPIKRPQLSRSRPQMFT
uniref:RING-type domain-containing protein n=1 Tax=Salix viminalis TaxID=40686 RepID=A0A6N2LI31_SALVM